MVGDAREDIAEVSFGLEAERRYLAKRPGEGQRMQFAATRLFAMTKLPCLARTPVPEGILTASMRQ